MLQRLPPVLVSTANALQEPKEEERNLKQVSIVTLSIARMLSNGDIKIMEQSFSLLTTIVYLEIIQNTGKQRNVQLLPGTNLTSDL